MPKKKASKSKPARPKRVQRRAVDKKPAFLAAFAACASLTEAAAAVGVDRGQHYDWLKQDPTYAAAFDAAKAQAGQALEDEAVARARVGVFEPFTYQGQLTYADYRTRSALLLEDGTEVFKEDATEAQLNQVVSARDVRVGIGEPLGVWRKSDGLLQFLLRGFLPAKYRAQTSVELSGPGGGPIAVTDKRLEVLTDDELSAFIAAAKKFAAAGGDGSGVGAAAKEQA